MTDSSDDDQPEPGRTPTLGEDFTLAALLAMPITVTQRPMSSATTTALPTAVPPAAPRAPQYSRPIQATWRSAHELHPQLAQPALPERDAESAAEWVDALTSTIQGAPVDPLWDISQHLHYQDHPELWSTLDALLAQRTKWSLASLRMAINRALSRRTQRKPRPPKPSALQPDQMARTFEKLLQASCVAAEYSTDLAGPPEPSPFATKTLVWHRLHARACPTCPDLVSPLELAAYNASSQCPFRHALAWLHHGFLTPLTELPSSSRPRNSPSLARAPSAVAAEFSRMRDEQNIMQGTLRVASPLLLVIKDSDVADAVSRLRSHGAHPAPHLADGSNIDALNEELSLLPPPHNKPVKARLAINFSRPSTRTWISGASRTPRSSTPATSSPQEPSWQSWT